MLIFYRSGSEEESGLKVSSGAVSDLRRAFSTVVEVCQEGGDGMPRSREEWEPIMAFWADRLERVQRVPEGFEEVVSG